MSEKSPESLMYELLRLHEECNQVASRSLGNPKGVFAELSLRKPKFAPAELGFMHIVSWLYALYQEAGKVGVEFISEKYTVYGLDRTGRLKDHPATVQKLRTYLQHNLEPGSTHNQMIQEACEAWFDLACSTRVPEKDEQWKRCLLSLLEEAVNFLSALRDCIRCIEKDESRDSILQQWTFRIDRYHPPHQFDELISIVAVDLGRENIDPERLRKRNYDKWSKELDLLQGTYDFNIEARKLIENALLAESVLPITGNDVMSELGIRPGPQVGQMLISARNLYAGGFRGRDELLEQLKKQMLPPP